jgi:Tfp pilus assembly protein PilN
MSTVQFNLLPDVKLEYYKTQRSKRLIYNLAFLVTAVSVGLMIITFTVANIVQRKALSDADGDIKKYSNQLQGTPDLEKILTVQNQLNSLPALHQQKHILSRLFDYIPQITPANVSIGNLKLDSVAGTITITGTSDKVETVNKFVDTLKFTSYTTGDAGEKNKAFSAVVLDTIGRDEKTVSYVVIGTYDPELFKADQNVKLVVPQELTTRSVTESPGAIFNGETGQTKATTDTKQGTQ